MAPWNGPNKHILQRNFVASATDYHATYLDGSENQSQFLVAPLARCEGCDLSSHVSVRDKKIVAGPIDPPPRKSPRVKVQTKTDQKVQCKGGLKLIFVDQIWVQSFKFNRLM